MSEHKRLHMSMSQQAGTTAGRLAVVAKCRNRLPEASDRRHAQAHAGRTRHARPTYRMAHPRQSYPQDSRRRRSGAPQRRAACPCSPHQRTRLPTGRLNVLCAGEDHSINSIDTRGRNRQDDLSVCPAKCLTHVTCPPASGGLPRTRACCAHPPCHLLQDPLRRRAPPRWS